MSDSIQFGKIYTLKDGGMNYTVSPGEKDGTVWAQCISHGLKLGFTTEDFLSKFRILNPDPEKLAIAAPVAPPVITDTPPVALNVTDTPPAGS